MPKGIFKRTEQHNKNISKALTNKKRLPFSKEWREKLSKSHKGWKGYWLGKKISEETKRKMSKTAMILGLQPPHPFGEKHWNWQGGRSFEPYSVDWRETLRRSIRERDHYICQKCSQYGNVVHHIDYNKQNCNPDNLITLCGRCNTKVNAHRNYWKNYFNEKQRTSK